MPLKTGAHLGAYEILGLLGAGGMGEVYRARDTRLGREVAIKVIPEELASRKDRLRRFEQEARATAALSHPNILALFDVGVEGGVHYIVAELLEGETLGERLRRGPLQVGKAIELAVQVCRALAVAHKRGIVHRDLKPANLFVTRDGQVKILDFGLAKLTQVEPQDLEGPAHSMTTAEGQVVGTVGYMAPEQVRGQAADARSDIFTLGAVLYEMLSGRRAFRGDTAADTMTAILTKEPEELSGPGLEVPASLVRIARRCLEKDPEDRFQSARDIAFALDAVSGPSTGAAAPAPISAPRTRGLLHVSAALVVGAVLVAVGIAAVGIAAGRRLFEKPPPTFKPLTFRRGWIEYARFAPDGRTVIYAAGWEGRPLEIFQTRTDSPESRATGLTYANVLAVSSQGQMAILVAPGRPGYIGAGTLAVTPVNGAAPPRELLTDVTGADWMPDGRDLCVSHGSGSTAAIELPPGNVIYRPHGATFDLRVSPDGRYAAFTDSGTKSIVALDLASRSTRTLVEGLSNFWGMSWAPSSRELWFTQGSVGFDAKDIFAVDLEGRRRLVYRSAGDLSLVDIAPDGRALLHRSACRTSVMASRGQDAPAQDVSVASSSWLPTISADGRALLFSEGSFDAYLRRVGSEPVRLAEGEPMDLSPDGSSALVLRNRHLEVVSIGPGLPRSLDLGAIIPEKARFIPPDGRRIVVLGGEREGEPKRFWVADLGGEKPRALDGGPPQLSDDRCFAVSPDGRFVARVSEPQSTVGLLPLGGGPTRDVGPVPAGLCVRRWSADGQSIFLARLGPYVSCQLSRFSLSSKRLDVLRDVAPADKAGVEGCWDIAPSADGSAVAYVHRRCLTDLILAEGLR